MPMMTGLAESYLNYMCSIFVRNSLAGPEKFFYVNACKFLNREL